MSAIDVLTNIGFSENGTEEFQALSDQLKLGHNGDHKILGAYKNGDVYAVLEQNVSPDSSGGVEVIMKHPAILILEGPKGRVAIPNADLEENADLIAIVARDLA